MKTFKQHLIEANAGLEMEDVIVAAARGEKYTPKSKIAPDAG